ncbi:enoyl-CoA hydratase [Desulfocucumis palustris]|uniref:Enoyl-CoA hydratase n=1 Tax=Desulfocucumis palustris TaxID=1898651 RepID=A0A2L2XBL0_9FIRM|nr:enoyl-CoA hydratase/isomerase family protein [Desulfocucumis palustris]GBF33697.1 enoyl-CoA hydratase [Desulfocucumis palustris]
MSFETVTYEVDGKVVRIGLNRPKAVNAIDGVMKRELLEAFTMVAQEKEAMVVVLFGHGNNFCSGVDLKDMAFNGWEHTPEGWAGHFNQLISTSRVMWNLDIPVIAAVKGFCLGGGCDLAMMADFVLAADNTRIGEPEIMMGAFAPTLIVPWLMGMKKAREFLVIGTELDAEEAKELGLINRVFPLDALDENVEKWVKHICNIPRAALKMSKKVLNKQYELMGLWDAIEYNREYSVILNLNKTREERMDSLKFIREQGLKALLKQLDEKTIVR